MKNLILNVLKEMPGPGSEGTVPEDVLLLPEGRIEIEGEEDIYLDAEAGAEVIAAFERRGNDMVWDYEHQTLKDVQAPAAGWIKHLAYVAGEGLRAAVEWTEKAGEYLKNREYRYFSPVLAAGATDRRVKALLNVALTNSPLINHLAPIVAKNQSAKEDTMIEKLRKLLGLAADAAEEKITEAVELMVNKLKTFEEARPVVACKEVLEALGAKADATTEEVVRVVASLKAPGDVAVQLSQEVAALKTKIAAMEQEDLVALALKDGKTSPEELDKWGRDLALKNPDSFRLIVLSRPAGSVIPLGGLPPSAPSRDGGLDDVQRQINALCGLDEETFKKYNN